jgi:hypothetical protein
MAEDPLKLFARRSERFPQPDDADVLRSAVEKGIEQIPAVGPILTFVTSRFWAPVHARRLELFWKEFADDFEKHCAECTVENLVNDEAFISASIQIARMVVATHHDEKREYLRNALLNVALGREPDDTKQQIFLNAIEAFSPAHVKALVLLRPSSGRKIDWNQHAIPLNVRNYASALGIIVPELKGQVSLISAIFAELRGRGFAIIDSPENLPYPQVGLITNLGIEFVDFVMAPRAVLPQ